MIGKTVSHYRIIEKLVGARMPLDRAATRLGGTGPQVVMKTRLGAAYARSGAIQKALLILDKARTDAEAGNPNDNSDIHCLEGEVELAKGNFAKGIELVTPADGWKRITGSPPFTSSAGKRKKHLHGSTGC